MMKVVLDGKNLSILDVYNVAVKRAHVSISHDALERVNVSWRFVEDISSRDEAYYGINTGFGDFAGVKIEIDKLKELQKNLIRSHQAGIGEPLPKDVVRAMMVLRINTLCRGNSGVRAKTLQTLVDMLNKGVHPVVPSRGSVGASGDLAPLSYIASVMIGEGMAEFGGNVFPANEALKKAGIFPVELCQKEGLALINGTQMMSGIGCLMAQEMQHLLDVADLVSSLSVDVLLGRDTPFYPQVHKARPHKGSIEVARNMLKFLKGSDMVSSKIKRDKVQDPYSLRCIPAIHGASRHGLYFAKEILTTEINSSLDNPLLFPEEGLVISCGNFHGAPVALALESMALSLSFISNASERRAEKILNHRYSNGLPPFLARSGGLNSGLMIAQYTAAALCSENKVLSHPACCDTIPTSAGQEDHVSMGSISALKLMNILKNTWYVLCVEALCGVEALDFRRPLKAGLGGEMLYRWVRSSVDPFKKDRPVGEALDKIYAIFHHEGFIREVEEILSG